MQSTVWVYRPLLRRSTTRCRPRPSIAGTNLGPYWTDIEHTRIAQRARVIEEAMLSITLRGA